jgi:hypothetical protein
VCIRVAEFALFARVAGFTSALGVLFDLIAPASHDFWTSLWVDETAVARIGSQSVTLCKTIGSRFEKRQSLHLRHPVFRLADYGVTKHHEYAYSAPESNVNWRVAT